MTTPRSRVVNISKKSCDALVSRPSFLGNPFIMGRDGTRAEVVEKYRNYFLLRVETDSAFRLRVLQLRGKSLGCHCAPRACHADVICGWLNEQEEDTDGRKKQHDE